MTPALSAETALSRIRIGHGFDVHPLVEGRPMILGGVEIPHSQGPLGHSDADVLLHAVIDALLGASGSPDIGSLFPNTDPRWKGASSIDLLKRAWGSLATQGYTIINLDCTVITEAPKVMPYAPQIRRSIASTLGVTDGAVGLKATTAEKLGSIGRGEGIAAFAVVLLLTPAG